MRIALGTVLCLLMAASLGLPAQEPPKRVRISAGVAEGLIVKKVEPVYPEMARIARIQGRVLSVLLSTGGRIENIKAISGHPILIQAAIDAVRQWQYRPFTVDGQPVEVETIVEVPFSLRPKEEFAKFEAALQTYRQQEEQCRSLVLQHAYAAETSCASLPELSEKLAPELIDERVLAYRDVGNAFLVQSKFQDARAAFLQELKIAKARHDPYDTDLAIAYQDAAQVLLATGDLEQARSNYKQAVKIFDHDFEQQMSPVLKKRAAQHLRATLHDYAKLLRQMGNDSEAEKFEKQAENLPADDRPQK